MALGKNGQLLSNRQVNELVRKVMNSKRTEMTLHTTVSIPLDKLRGLLSDDIKEATDEQLSQALFDQFFNEVAVSDNLTMVGNQKFEIELTPTEAYCKLSCDMTELPRKNKPSSSF